MKISHEEFIDLQKQRVVLVSQKILNGQIGLIEGAQLLTALSNDVADGQDDSDFILFIAIESETDHLPVGLERQNWADYALVEKDKEIEEVESFFRSKVTTACKVLIERFSKKS